MSTAVLTKVEAEAPQPVLVGRAHAIHLWCLEHNTPRRSVISIVSPRDLSLLQGLAGPVEVITVFRPFDGWIPADIAYFHQLIAIIDARAGEL